MTASSFPVFASADDYPGASCTDRFCYRPFNPKETVFRTECSVCSLEAPFKGLNIRHLQCAYQTLTTARAIKSDNLLGLFTCSESLHEPAEGALAELVAHSHLLEADIGRRIGHRRTLSESALSLTGSVVNFAGGWFHKGRDFVSKSVAGSQRPIIDSATEALRSQRFGNLTRKMLGEGAVAAYPEVRDDAASQVSDWRAIRVRPRSAPGSPTRLSERGIVRARSHESLFSEFEKVSLRDLPPDQDESLPRLEACAAALEPETATYVVTRHGKTLQEFGDEWARQRALASIKAKAVGLDSAPIESTDLVGNVTFTVRWQKKQGDVADGVVALAAAGSLITPATIKEQRLVEVGVAAKGLDGHLARTVNSEDLGASVRTVEDGPSAGSAGESVDDFVPIVLGGLADSDAAGLAAISERGLLLADLDELGRKLDQPGCNSLQLRGELTSLRARVEEYRASQGSDAQLTLEWDRVSQFSFG